MSFIAFFTLSDYLCCPSLTLHFPTLLHPALMAFQCHYNLKAFSELYYSCRPENLPHSSRQKPLATQRLLDLPIRHQPIRSVQAFYLIFSSDPPCNALSALLCLNMPLAYEATKQDFSGSSQGNHICISQGEICPKICSEQCLCL